VVNANRYTPAGELGINIGVALESHPLEGLLILIPPWSMEVGDSVEMLLGSDVVASETIDAGEVGIQVATYIASARLTDGPTTLSYRVTRFGQIVDTSADLAVYVKLDRPGGTDENGSEPGHSELVLEIPQEIIDAGIDKDQAEKGVPVTVKSYPNMAEHDSIRLSWGGYFVVHTVVAAEVGQDIELIVTKEIIEDANDTGPDGLAVTFQVVDLVDNASDGWSAAIKIVVDLASDRLDAPFIAQANNNELDLDLLGNDPVTVQIVTRTPPFLVGDKIAVTLKGTAIDETPVSITLDPVTLTRVGNITQIDFPNAGVRQLAGAQAVFSYAQIRASVPDKLSKGCFITVIGEAERLAAPLARDASQGSLDPTLPQTVIEIPWDASMSQGQVIDLKWMGKKPNLGTYFPALPPHPITHGEEVAQATIPITVSGTHLTPINGGTLDLYYELLTDVGALVPPRQSLHAALLNVGEPKAELPVPEVEGQRDGVLNPDDVPTGTRLIVPVYDDMFSGDEVHCQWSGSETGVSQDWIKLNRITVGHPVPFPIAHALVAGNLSGTVQASYHVVRAEGRTSTSDVLALQIGDAQESGLVVTVDGVVDGELDLDAVTGGVRTEVAPYDGMGSGDQVNLYWADDKLSPPYTDSKPVSGAMVGKPVPFTVPIDVAQASLDGNVTVACEAILFDESTRESLPVEFRVVRGEAAMLPAPGIAEAVGDKLDPNNARRGATVVIGSEARLQTGDIVTLTWEGQPGDGSVMPVKEAVSDGELQIVVPYSTVAANDGHAITLSYTVKRKSGDQQGPSPLAVFDVLSAVASGQLKIMGARYNRSSYRASACSRLLSAFNATTMQPIDAQWQYEGDTTWVTAKTLRDTDSWKLLHVKTNDDLVTLNPANIIGNGTDAATAGQAAFVAHRDVGDVVGWGTAAHGALIPSTIITMDDIVEISCTRSAFAARRQNKSVVAWGTPADGGSLTGVSPLGFASVAGNSSAFAGLNTVGQVVAWGLPTSGGTVPAAIGAYTDITHIVGTGTAFAAQRLTGQVVAWGAAALGGTVPVDIATMTDIVEVMGNFRAFAAWRANKRLVAWGDAASGSVVPPEIAALTDIIELSAATARAFAARRATGQMVAWGAATHGGTVPDLIVGLTDIVGATSTWESFAALRANGRVVAWGGSAATGGVVPAEVAALDDIVQLASSSRAFAALRRNGTVVAWGDKVVGGDTGPVVGQLTDVLALYSNTNGFVALTGDRRVVTWGHPTGGGDSTAAQALLAGQVSYKATAVTRGRAVTASRLLSRALSASFQG
jgi:hypothetical protein